MLNLETPVDSLPIIPTTGPGEEFMATAGWGRWQRAVDLFLTVVYLEFCVMRRINFQIALAKQGSLDQG